MEITFKSPINKSPEKEGFLLCRKLRCIQKQIQNKDTPKRAEMMIELYL